MARQAGVPACDIAVQPVSRLSFAGPVHHGMGGGRQGSAGGGGAAASDQIGRQHLYASQQHHMGSYGVGWVRCSLQFSPQSVSVPGCRHSNAWETPQPPILPPVHPVHPGAPAPPRCGALLLQLAGQPAAGRWSSPSSPSLTPDTRTATAASCMWPCSIQYAMTGPEAMRATEMRLGRFSTGSAALPEGCCPAGCERGAALLPPRAGCSAAPCGCPCGTALSLPVPARGLLVHSCRAAEKLTAAGKLLRPHGHGCCSRSLAGSGSPVVRARKGSSRPLSLALLLPGGGPEGPHARPARAALLLVKPSSASCCCPLRTTPYCRCCGTEAVQTARQLLDPTCCTACKAPMWVPPAWHGPWCTCCSTGSRWQAARARGRDSSSVVTAAPLPWVSAPPMPAAAAAARTLAMPMLRRCGATRASAAAAAAALLLSLPLGQPSKAGACHASNVFAGHPASSNHPTPYGQRCALLLLGCGLLDLWLAPPEEAGQDHHDREE